MDEQLTDQQQAERMRTWLGEHIWYLLAGLVLGLGGLFGWRQWEAHRIAEAEQASTLYAEMLEAVRVDRDSRARELAGQIVSEHGSSPYADQARLAMARVDLEDGKPQEAVQYLRETMDRSSSDVMAHIARQRLARVLMQQEQPEEALKLLEVPEKSAFAARYHELRGDALYALGRLDEARREYEAALQGAENGMIDQGFVQAKLNELGGSTTATVPAAAASSPAQ